MSAGVVNFERADKAQADRGQIERGQVVRDQVLNTLQGLPGAGKSTWAAAWCAQDPQHRVVVNRDGIRFELFGAYRGLSDEQEAVVSDIEFLRVDRALGAALSVAVDATHLEAPHRDRWATLADRHGVRHEIVTLNTPLAECLRRNRARAAAGGRFVPEDIIMQMNATAEPAGESNTC
ncbi:AAA family ATPase [Mycolicibacterium wolinskyi]|uniref:ATP-binding protein n=1 Tax=Mycolicibacterium wolinskyi TaxID=59750 RepID=A0A1X2FJE5_9MYCO|nr:MULTISPECIES: AAA family ATPase [Mycolicibacterium]MCV7286129.1 AAA family ATPase [Mycolicibacterium wolinskyi]MCV7296325.1 AAA family ATPase [Mycolicibacterium goodii]ORX18546.1 hypothetical protein AWC31_14720 [Mycolicibacterium wolinskyi]